MLSLSIENHKGNILNMTQNTAYTITSITGLNPAAANINTVDAAMHDGSTFNSSKVGVRNIVINFVIENPAERNRIQLYNYIKPKKSCILHISNGQRAVTINGYAEALDIDFFENKQSGQISVLCPQPFFVGTENQSAEFTSTYTADNGGDIETGAVFTLTATGGAVVNPVFENTSTDETFGVDYTIPDGGILTINTNKGQKAVILTNGGTTTNLINYIVQGSAWLQLDTGENEITFTADTGAEYANCGILFDLMFEGV